MTKEKLLKTIYWIILAMALVAFYIGLRYEEQKWLYTLIALGLWVISYLIHKQIKKSE